MTQESVPPTKRFGARSLLKAQPYWYLILLIVLATTVLFVNHLATQTTPNRVAFHIELFDFDVYWYGILIVTGIALGSFVTSRLAIRNARRLFRQEVPSSIQEEPITTLDLSEELQESLQKRGIQTIAPLLFEWGLHPERLGVKRAARQEVGEGFSQHPDIEKSWLTDAPWRSYNPDHVWAGLAWCLVLGVIGARLYHVFTPSPSMAAVGINSPLDYFRNPMQLINIRSGGLGIFGAIAGGALGLLLYARRHRIGAIIWADLVVAGMAIGQYVGRWGNFINQELYGRPSDLPWAVYIEPIYRLDNVVDFDRFHPAFLYESLWSLLTFVILITLTTRYHKRLRPGDLVALYIIFYSVGRILLELVRLDSRTIALGTTGPSIPIASLVSLVIALPMTLFLVRRHLLTKD